MTAINVLRQRHCVTMYTDTAAYGLDGVVQGFGQKSIVIPQLRTVLATRGALSAAVTIGLECGLRFRSFDDLVSPAGEAFIEATYENSRSTFAMSGQSRLDLLIAGWSDADDCPRSFAMSSSDAAGLDPFTWTDLDEMMVFPMIDVDLAYQFGCSDAGDPEAFDPVKDGIAVMQAQRHTVFPLQGDDGIGRDLFIVGGEIVMTQITEADISQRVIHRWPGDKVGELIRPFA